MDPMPRPDARHTLLVWVVLTCLLATALLLAAAAGAAAPTPEDATVDVTPAADDGDFARQQAAAQVGLHAVALGRAQLRDGDVRAAARAAAEHLHTVAHLAPAAAETYRAALAAVAADPDDGAVDAALAAATDLTTDLTRPEPDMEATT